MYERILVPVDGSDASLRGLREALSLAKTLGASVRLITVVNELILDHGYVPSGFEATAVKALRASGQKALDEACRIAGAEAVPFESALIETLGTPAADCIINQAKQWSAQLIVMGTHGRRGLRRLALGSDAELVLRSSTVPVLLIRVTPEAS